MLIIKNIFLAFLFLTSVSFVQAQDGMRSQGGEESGSRTNDGISFITSLFSAEIFLNFLFAIGVLVGTFILSKIISSKLGSYFESHNKEHDQIKEGAYGMISRTINITIWFIGITLSFGVMGLDLGLFLGGIGLGLGFTMQIFLSNFIFGIIMVTQGTIRIGDMIDLGGELSKVEKVSPLFTEVVRLDGVKKFIPNIKFLQDSVANLYLNEKRRLDVDIKLYDEADVSKFKLVVAKVLDTVPGVLKDPSHTIWFMGIGEKGIDVKILFRIESRVKPFTTRSNVVETLNLAFKQAQIEVAFMNFMNVTISEDKKVKHELKSLSDELKKTIVSTQS